MRRLPAVIVILGLIAIAALAMQATAQNGPLLAVRPVAALAGSI
jgi:hypothetical protein